MSTTIESLELEIVSNSQSAVSGIDALTQSLKKLKRSTKNLGLNSASTEMKKLGDTMKKVTNENKKAAGSFTDLFHKIKAGMNVISRLGKKVWSAVENSMDYTENMNLFTVAMGKYAEEAYSYAEKVSGAMGIDTSEWIRAQGVFQTLSTGFGIAGDRATTMSTNLTQLGYDLASFYNISTEDAMLKLQSGLSGELEPLRRLGYDLSQAKLEATALALGIDKSVSAMTQAEKAELRYYAIMTQVTDTHGDMARTLESPANQLRIFKSEMSMAAREIGNIFIPALTAILPYATAVAKVIRIIASGIADLVGFERTGIEEGTTAMVENTDAVTENIQDAQDEVKKLKSYMLGFDELNVINPNTESGTDVSGTFNFELPDYTDEFMAGLEGNKVNGIVEKMKEWLGITEDIDSWSDLMETRFGNILVTIGYIGGALLLWKIGKSVLTFIKNFKSFTKGLKTLGMFAVIGAAIAGTSYLVTHTEDTMTKIGGILSGASLAVGAILAFTGVSVPLGVALMAIGAVSLGSAIAMNMEGLSEEIKGVIAIITSAVSVALLAVGAILAFSGVNIPLGIALMAGGALVMATAVLPSWGKLSDSVQSAINILMVGLGGAVLALGAILAFSGANIPLGIGLMLAGAASIGTAVALNWDSIKSSLEGPVGGITALISTALLALGGILAFTGVNLPLGIALMATGAIGLATVTALNWDSILNALQGPVGGVVSLISEAVLALGGMLAFTGTNIPLGIALMAAGAVGLASVVALNWNTIIDKLQGPVGLVTGLVSGALLALGMILLFSGAGVGLGIGLILGGAAGVASAVAVNWNFLTDKIKEVWEKVKAFWNTYIAPIFTGEWWKKLGKTCINGLIWAVETGLNWLIGAVEDALNWLIDGTNDILALGVFDYELIPRVSWSGVDIPRLADGGFVNEGQLFIAREAGAEMVGNIGRRTAVANNDQIVSGIAGGVAEANEEQNALLREQNSLLRAILEKDSSVYLDGKNLTNSVEKYQRERGRNLIVGGVL